MATADTVTHIGSAAEDDDLILALTMQMDELQFEQESYKGKERAGQQPDWNFALEYYQNVVNDLVTFYNDRKMASSIADAVYQDAQAIEAIVAAENTATRDREQVLRMENATATATPPVDNDDTASIFTDYERYTTLPPHIFEPLSDDDDGQSEAGPSSRPQAKALDCFAEQITCGVCNDYVPAGISVRCPCGHIYCRECLRRVAHNAIKDESMYPLKCCKQEVPVETLMKVLAAAECQEYMDAGVEYATADRVYCTNKGCLKFIPPDRVEHGTRAACTACGTRVCTRCKNEEHLSSPCRTTDEEVQAVLNLATENGWRRCHRCQQMIELHHGCNHMTCPCGAEFCYECGAQWKNCGCDTWQENRLLEAAARRVDRDADEPLVPAVRAQRIERAQYEIRQNHDCTHPGRFQRRTEYRRRGYRCDLCAARHWKYILACRHCDLLACESCRRFRVR
ncbi:hypothetical protein TWF696_007979 [Orbilia brochopaga]|uniref:RBR-type E3 ubiquitin transferase n=1 Tax=Orbilia brochopaga TaxID=3140254 RepID=A0AAV9UP59_9PEZI